MFRLISLLIIFACGSVSVNGQKYIPADDASSIKFSIKNFGVNVNGSFHGIKGDIVFNEKDPASAAFNISINAATVNTGIKARDKHLNKEEYLDTEHYPLIKFVSSKVSASGKAGSYILNGTITIKGASKEIQFPFTVSPQNNGLLFTAEFKLNRRDFKVGGSSITMSDNLAVVLSVSAKK